MAEHYEADDALLLDGGQLPKLGVFCRHLLEGRWSLVEEGVIGLRLLATLAFVGSHYPPKPGDDAGYTVHRYSLRPGRYDLALMAREVTTHREPHFVKGTGFRDSHFVDLLTITGSRKTKMQKFAFALTWQTMAVMVRVSGHTA